LWLLAPTATWAHGSAPIPSGVAISKTTWVATTPYGLLRSPDDGATWAWICEDVLGLGVRHDPALLVSTDGRLVVGTGAGLSVSSDGGCGWLKPAAALGSGDVGAMLRLAGPPERLLAWLANTAGDVTQLVVSSDGGATWSAKGKALPLHTLALSLQATPTAPDRLYATVLDGSLAAEAALLTSDDGGDTWLRRDLPQDLVARVVALDPAGRIYVRATSGGHGVLWMSPDAGVSWQTVFTTEGPIVDAALAPDGLTLWLTVAAPQAGLYAADTAELKFTLRSPLPFTCLHWHDGALVACADEASTGFSIGQSLDGGVTWSSRLRRKELRPLSCPPGSQVAASCPSQWPLTAAGLGITPASPERPADESSCTATPKSVGTTKVPWLSLCGLAVAGLLARRRRITAGR
jgi:photosystem II stability/assembly factor-like uncharacterized protein